MKSHLTAAVLIGALFACTPLAVAGVLPSLTTTLTMDCTAVSTACTFDPGTQGSPELGVADFGPVAPGWSAEFQSMPALSWGIFVGVYQAQFGSGGSFSIAAPGGLFLSGTLSSGVAFSFPNTYGQTVAWFQGYWNNGLYADGIMIGDTYGTEGASATLVVTTYSAAPEPGSFLLFGSALAGLATRLRKISR